VSYVSACDHRRAAGVVVPRRVVAVAAALAATVLVTAVGFAGAAAASDRLAKQPPMGWNDWYAVGCDTSEQVIEETADAFVRTGLKAAGYEYVGIDACWQLPQRDAEGRLVPDPQKFPSGIKAVADYVHSRGLKLGIYEDGGSVDCGGGPGSLGHEQIDADTFAAWGVDLLKYDNCGEHGPYPETQAGYEARYTAMGDALKRTGRAILFDLAEWGVSSPWEWGDRVGNMWSVGENLSAGEDSWGALKRIIEENAPLAPFAHPGAWNNPDHLQVGLGGMTDTEYRTHFSLWAEMAAPLLIGSDVRNATPATMKILLNRDVIAVDQDPLGIQGRVVQEHGTTLHGNKPYGVPEVFSKPLVNGDRAVALYNASDAARTITVSASRVGLPRAAHYELRDLWSGVRSESAGTISARVPAHGTTMYRISALRSRDEALPPATTLSVTASDQADPSRPAVVAPGMKAHVATTLLDEGTTDLRDVRVTVQAPAGWTVRPRGAHSRARLGSGDELLTDWEVQAPSTAAPGSYRLRVTGAYRWNGSPFTVAETLEVHVIQPPPAGTTGLSALDWFSADVYYAPVVKDANVVNFGAGDDPGNLKPMTIAGTTYPKGLGTSAPTSVVYYLGGRCSRLVTDVGIDDTVSGFLLWGWVDTGGHAIFRIKADGKTVAETDVKTAAQGPSTLSANVKGATWVELEADDAGSTSTPEIYGDTGYWWDRTDWAMPQLTCR
jgi:alpha-galactosidase